MDEPLIATDSRFAWLAWLFAYAISFGVLAVFVRNLRRARRARNWPVVDGRVLNVTQEADDGVTTITVEYEYEVGGVTHRGDRFRFGSGSYQRRRDVEAILGRYQRGAAVSVHYDPSNPASSVLETRFEWGGWLIAALFALVIFAVWTYQLIVAPPPAPWGS